MNRFTLVSLSLSLLGLGGCADTKDCEAFAEHMADVLTREKGESVDPEIRAKMLKKTTESCVADPPSPAALECAMKAPSTEAMTECDALSKE